MNNSYQHKHHPFPKIFLATLIVFACYVYASNAMFSIGEMAPAHTLDFREEVK